MSVPPSVTMDSYDIREMTFQSVVDKILKPSGIKMGGFPVELFTDLTDAEQQKFMCNICYMIANDCRCCTNKHVFCRSCILAWSMTLGENSSKCPFCRCNQTEYHAAKELDDELKEKQVHCLAADCTFKCPLRYYLRHSHGRMNYSNADVDFGRIQTEQRHFIPLPSLAVLEADNVAAGAASMRQQLMQGRTMINQMMLLMHLEMQLRRQALVSYQEAHDPAERMRQLDDVMALNEQLNELGSILGMLLNAPLDHVAAAHHAATAGTEPRHPPGTVGGRFRAPGTPLPRFNFPIPVPDSDDDDDDDDGTEDEVTDVSRAVSIVVSTDSDDDDDYVSARASTSSDTSVWNSFSFDNLSPPGHRLDRSAVAETIGVEGTHAARDGVSRPTVVNRNDSDSNGTSSVQLIRRRSRPTTPHRMTVDRSPVSVTLNELHLPPGVRPPSTVGTLPSLAVSFPQIQSRGATSSRRPPTPPMREDRANHAVAGRQRTDSVISADVAGLSNNTPRQLEPLSMNRPFGLSSVVHGSSQQTIPIGSHMVRQVGGRTIVGRGSLDASQPIDSRHAAADGSGVLTEPWPVHSSSQSQSSANRSSVATARGGPRQSRAGNDVLGIDRPSDSPRGAVPKVPSNRPALPMRRSSVRHALGRPAGPASLLSRAAGIPFPHPSATGSQHQGFGNRTTPRGGPQASNDMWRPRRRSEIAHQIMFPPQNNTRQ